MAAAATLQFGDRRATLREHGVFAGKRAIEYTRGIREQGDIDADHGRQTLDLFHVAGFHPAGDDVDLAVFLRGWFGHIGHGLDHIGESGDMRADVTRGRGADHRLALGGIRLVPGFFQDLGQVVTDGFRQTGGMYCYDLGIIDSENGIDRLQQVGLPAEDRGTLGERTGGGGDRFLVVPGQRAAVVGAAALRAVAVRQAAVDAQRRVHGADRLACLGRVDHQGLTLGYLFGCMSE